MKFLLPSALLLRLILSTYTRLHTCMYVRYTGSEFVSIEYKFFFLWTERRKNYPHYLTFNNDITFGKQ